MRRFAQVCQLVGVIKPLPYGSEKIIYETRFKAFEAIPVPKYVSYEVYRETMEKELAEENAFENLLDEAKQLMTQGQKRLGMLIALPETARMTELLPTEMLKSLQKLAIKNSLNIVKHKMQKANASDLVLTIDGATSLPMCPSLDLKPKAQPKK